MLLQGLRQLQRVAARVEGPFRDFQLEIQLAELEISGRQVRYESGRHFFLSPLIGEKICSGSFGGAAILSPKIEVIGGGRSQLSLRDFISRDRTDLWALLAGDVAAGAQRRKLIGASDSELRLSLQDSRRCDANVIVILERGANQALKLRILEDLPPLLVSQGLRWPARPSLFGLAWLRLRVCELAGASAVDPRYVPGTSTAGRL